MKSGASGAFGAQLKALREAAGFTQEELATIAGLSVHAVSALERGQRRRPHVETVRALSAALDLSGANRDVLFGSARTPPQTEGEERNGVSLPLSLTSLLGRDADVRTLRSWLADPAVRLITLIGPGGAGKTRLALELARAIAAEGATRVVFVPLAATRNAAFVASATAEALGLSDVTPLELPNRVRVACQNRDTLLVLDSFEHVLDAAPLAAELLASAASLRLLVTSRAPLRVRGEREYLVGPLASLEGCSAEMSPADLARSPAVRLFVERVRDVRPEFRLTRANGRTVTAICRRLDALPLALELAAPWIKVLTVEELLDRLTHGVLQSAAGPRDLPERQQTINATVGWSYRLLASSEQRVFRRLGVLPCRFSIEAAAAVLAGRENGSDRSDDALGAAASLIDKSLLARVESSVPTRPLYQMLETVRAYATLELDAAGERDDALEGLARYCTTEVDLAATELVGPAQAEWLDRVRDDLETYRCVLSWLIDRGRPIEASSIAWSLVFYWLIRGHSAEAIRWYEQILEMPSLPPIAESRALVGAALIRHTKGELGRARDELTRAVGLARDVGDRALLVQAEHLSGHVDYALGNLPSARERLTRTAEEFRTLAMPWGTGNALAGMASVALATGDADEALRLLDEATSELQHAGPWFLMPVLYVRAILEVRRGHADRAIALVRENLTRIRELNDRFAFVYALIPLAAAAVLKGEDVWAARILGARDAVLERSGVTIVETPVDDLRNRAERQARERLGPDKWARAYEAGRKTAIDSADDLARFVAAGPR